MKLALLRNHFVYACNCLQSPFKFNTKHPNILSARLAALTRHRLRLYSSQSGSSNSAGTQNNNGSADVEDVSSEELRRRIEKYLEGDEEAIPSIFEAILSRKLAGKHEESDDDLMEEIKRPTATSNGVSHQELDSDED